MLVPIPYVHAGIGLLLAVFSVPLILRRVPMNRYYGVRVSKAYVSDANWYALNAFGGKVLFVLGLIMLGFGVIAASAGIAAPAPSSPWAPLFMIVPMLALLPGLWLIVAYARKLPEQ